MTFQELAASAEGTVTLNNGEVLYIFSIRNGAGDQVRYRLVDKFERLIASVAFSALSGFGVVSMR